MAQRQFRSDDTSLFTERFGNSSDGAYAPSTGTDTVTDSACTGTISTTSLSATNASFATGQLILIHQTRGTGAGQWELNKIASYSAGTITTSYPLVYGYVSGAQVLVMPQYSSGNIATGQTITGKAWNGTVGGIYAKFCSGTFTVTGNIYIKGADGIKQTGGTNGNGGGFRGGGGYVQGVGGPAVQGESEVGAGGNSINANGSGGGGAQGNTVGGTAYQTVAALTTRFTFGGAGGGGKADRGTAPTGANGGGLILIIAKTITVTGAISANGGVGYSNGTNDWGDGGGGAGGCVLLKGQSLTLGTALVTSSGGNGGTGGSGGKGAGGGGSADGAAGDSSPLTGAGAVGRIHADYSTLLSGTTSPTIDSSLDAIFVDSASGGNYAFFI